MVVMAALWVAGCGSRKAQQAQGDQPGATTAQMQVPRVRMPYVIPEAGVHFNPPLSWDPERIAVVTVTGDDAAALQHGADYAVSFNYKAEQPAHENAPLLRLFVLRRTQWNRVSDRDAAGEVVDSTGDWVYVASLPKQLPYRPDLLDADQFKAMRLSMDDVHSAFSVEKGGPADTSLRAESRRK
jgi:hypothetical protein